MKHRSILLFTATAFLISGCTAKTSEPTQATTPAVLETPPKAFAEPSASEQLGQKLKKGIAYEDLRKIVLTDGWLPLVTPECKENVGGEAKICNQLPELDACSGDGHCVMWFAHGPSQTKLRVDTYGDYRRWDVAGHQAKLIIKTWEFPVVALPNPTKIACPSQHFEEFLKRFASDREIQTAFTSSFIKIEELVLDGEEGLDTREVFVNKSDYKDFNLQYAIDGFHVLDSDDKVDPSPTPLQIKSENPETYYVKYLYGMSEGNSYRFHRQNGCWNLIADPDAPSP